MTLIRQPRRSRLCGHCCVAMALAISLDEAVRLIGHRHGTKADELRKALASRGVSVLPTSLTAYAALPQRAIIRLTIPRRRNWHWMLLWDGMTYDPSGDAMERPGAKITSFMEIR